MSKTTQLTRVSASLPAMQAHLQVFLAEYEAKIAQTRAQLAHLDALLSSLPIETIASTNGINHCKRPSLFGSDKDKIIIGKKFDLPLTEEFQDIV
jgi:hypothetical protein